MLNLIFGPHTNLVRQRKIRHRVFTSPITRLIRTFRVAIEQWRQKNVRTVVVFLSYLSLLMPFSLPQSSALHCRYSVPGWSPIDVIRDTRHLCRRFRTNGIKAMSTWYFRGQTSDKICQYELSRSLILSRRDHDFSHAKCPARVLTRFSTLVFHCFLWGYLRSLLHPKK